MTGGARTAARRTVDVQIVWDRLITIVEEQARTLIRTAFSSTLSEGADLSAGVFDTQGNMLAQAVTGTPGHINCMATGVGEFLERFGPANLADGDVLIGNDPYAISGHLLDVTLVTPVFADSLVAYVASTCHAVDMGGVGFSLRAESTFEEGIYLPYIKLYEAGRPVDSVWRIIEANVRNHREVLGDLRAQVAGNDVAARGLRRLLVEFPDLTVAELSGEIIGRSAAAMRSAISERLPHGTYVNETVTDGPEGPLPLRAAVTVSDAGIEVDFEGSAPATRQCLNVCLPYAQAYATFGLKAALAPEIPNNQGVIGTISVRAPEDCVVNARRPRPTQARHVLGQAVTDTVLGALTGVLGDRILAESATPLWIVTVQGDTEVDTPFAFTFFLGGGMGASAHADGLSATIFPAGARGTSVEIIEKMSPILFRQKELRPDSGGPGAFRGGLGQVVRFTVGTRSPWTLPAWFGCIDSPPRGLAGGGAGAAGSGTIAIPGDDGHWSETSLRAIGTYRVPAGSEVTLRLPGGGGFGNPRERSTDAVERDRREGYVTVWPGHGPAAPNPGQG
jgi:N-methylhydantoinase B/oxoprolinase/acetone carboxylase alpha subunit